ncbi:MAG: ABC transporter permease [Actinobacteria bacterium]|nr:ABC transporter permease [Actinomycetota bacterium]
MTGAPGESGSGGSRVGGRTTEDLGIDPPPRQRYPVRLGTALRELSAGRELLLTFAERDLRVRYKQTILGAFWAVLQPFLLMVIFSVVFGRIARVGSEGVPYPVFAYSALVPWGFFSAAVTYGTTCLVVNGAIVRKIYLPREVFPLSSVLSSAADFATSALILLLMLLGYGFFPTMAWLSVVPLLLALTLFAVASTLLVSAVTVYFRDSRFVVPTILQLVLYATPIAYPIGKGLAALPEGMRPLYPYLNPLVPILDGFRRALVHGQWPRWGQLGFSAALGLALLTLAYRWYKRLDASFPDVI